MHALSLTSTNCCLNAAVHSGATLFAREGHEEERQLAGQVCVGSYSSSFSPVLSLKYCHIIVENRIFI